jgi:hypothetical protein
LLDLEPFEALALSLHHSPGTLAILVGSGLSRSAGIATGWEITLDLVRRYAAVKGVTEVADWPAWYKAETGRDPNYSELLDALAATPSERREILHGYIEPQPDAGGDARRPTKAHHAIARLVADGRVRVIITTNFDRLLENALRDAGVEPIVIAHEDALAGAVPLVHARCTVIKVHGDYLDSRIKNTDAELGAYGSAMNDLLDEVFDRFGLISVGWSGEWDQALRDAIQRAPSRRYPFYWAARGVPAPLAADLIEQRKGRSFTIADADSFFFRLDNTLQALAQAGRPHPVSAAMAVAVAKRYCRDEALALEWTELLAAEAAKIRQFVLDPAFHQGAPDTASLNDLINRFIARSEVFRRVCLVAGRWGGPSAAQALARILRELQFREAPRDGYVCLRSLRSFAASLGFYWFLAGCVAGERWTLAIEMMRAKIRLESTDLHYATVLPPSAFEHVDWKFLTGMENRHTPVSDYLVEVLRGEISDIAVPASETDRLFDDVEQLIAIEFAHHRQRRVEAGNSSWFWAPVGRFVWRGSRGSGDFQPRLDEVVADPGDHPWLVAGLAGGDLANIKVAVTALRGHMANCRIF